RQMEGDLCTAEAHWEKSDASSPCNTLPRVGGEGRNSPVSKCILCNSETRNSLVWPTAHHVLAAGWLNGDPHGGTAGLYQKMDRIINLIVGGLTTLLLVVTLISAFVFPQLPPKPVNVFFAFCISLCCISAGILIYWYRQGDLEPKFRNLIYYILFSIVMLCICANLYFHEVERQGCRTCPAVSHETAQNDMLVTSPPELRNRHRLPRLHAARAVIEYHQLNTTIVKDDLSELSR
ncbi:transmembrane protein 243, partial [Lamprotornis superbus]